MELKKLHIYNLNNVLYTISLLHISLGAMIFVSLFALHGSTSLKHTDNNYSLGNEVNYKCHSSINVLQWKFTIGNETTQFSFANRREGYSTSHSIKSVNLTAIITRTNTTTTAVFTFLASCELHGGMETCNGEFQHFYINDEVIIQPVK